MTAERLESKCDVAVQPSCYAPPRAWGSSEGSRGGSPWCLPSKLAKAANKYLEFQARGAGGRNQDDLGQSHLPIKKCTFTPLSTGIHALIWAQQLSGLFRVCVIMTSAFASAAPRKLSIWGEGGWLAKNKKGSPRSESMQEVGTDELAKGMGRTDGWRSGPTQWQGERGRTESWVKRARAPRTTPLAHCPLPWGKAGQQLGLKPASSATNPVGTPFAQGPHWASGP